MPLFSKYKPVSGEGFNEDTRSYAMVVRGLIENESGLHARDAFHPATQRTDQLINDAAKVSSQPAINLEQCRKYFLLERHINQLIHLCRLNPYFKCVENDVNILSAFKGRTDLENYNLYDSILDHYTKIIEKLNEDPTILHLVTSLNCELVAMDLVDLGASLANFDKNNETPLTTAIIISSVKCVDALLQSGADPQFKNGKLQLPLTVAQERMVDTRYKAHIIELLDKQIALNYIQSDAIKSKL